MKSMSLLFLFALLLLISNRVNSSHKTISYIDTNVKVVSLLQNQYAVTGRTRNQFGQNFSISLRITGNVNSFSSHISKVEYNDGNDWIQTQYHNVFGQGGVYYVNIDFKKYYFEF